MAVVGRWWWLLFFCFTSFVVAADAFLKSSSCYTQVHLYSVVGEDIGRYDAVCNSWNKNKFSVQRRTFLETASFTGLVTANINDAHALDGSPNTIRDRTTGNFDCLLDLPPITPGCARLYLCRHGQTENNRLRIMQGARVDPPINSNGYEQAQRLGIAVARLRDNDDSHAPTLVEHSKLLRAKETAFVLTSLAKSSSKRNQQLPLQVYGEVPSLGEVDFGSLEDMDVKSARTIMMSTFALWSMGDIDKRAGGGGESGREVLERAVLALETLGKVAVTSSTPQGSTLAVSHSTYLQILLSLVAEAPLAESVLRKINNGSVNVVDVNVEGKQRLVSFKSGIFGGLKWSNDLLLTMPECHLIRRNEVRHLDGMQISSVPFE